MNDVVLSAEDTVSIETPMYNRQQLEAMFLPTGQMLQIDRVLKIDGQGITCEMDVAKHWVFPLHFPTDPIFPGTLLIEAAGQTVAIWAWSMGLRGRPRLVKVAAKFESPVLPQDGQVRFVGDLRLRRKNICMGRVNIHVGDRSVAKMDGTLIIISQLDLPLAGGG